MAQEKKSKVSILTNGIIKENPVLRLVLGTCSTLAVTTISSRNSPNSLSPANVISLPDG